MVVVIREEDVGKIIRAWNIKRRIMELEREIGRLSAEKAKLEEEYANLGIKVE